MGVLEFSIFFIIAAIVFFNTSITKAKKEQANYKKAVINNLIKNSEINNWYNLLNLVGDT